MTNNLKILVILSIFVFILTGYFCFSSPSIKNQIITNNNDKEEKDNKDIDINSKDNNKKDNKGKKNGSLISAVLRLIIFTIFIVIVGVIVFIIVNRKKFKKKVNKFEFKVESKKDFKRENFCPTFFAIHIPKAIEKSKEEGIEIDDVKEDTDSFFKILTGLILSKNKINNINKVEFFRAPIENKNNAYCFNLKNILDEINNFASLSKIFNQVEEIRVMNAFIKPLIIKIKEEEEKKKKKKNEEEEEKNEEDNDDNNNEEIKEIKSKIKEIKFKFRNSKTKIEEIQEKYGEEFYSYLCSYLLYYLSETIGNNGIKVEISNPKKEEEANENIKINFTFFLLNNFYGVIFDSASETSTEIYKVNYDIIYEILKKLINDKPLQNVTYTERTCTCF